MNTLQAHAPEMNAAPTLEQYLDQPPIANSGVYRSVNTAETGAPAAELEPVLEAIVERAVGTVATGRAIGMASLPEEYREQQLHKFTFTAQEYAAYRGYQAETLQRMNEQFLTGGTEDDDESDEDNPHNKGYHTPDVTSNPL